MPAASAALNSSNPPITEKLFRSEVIEAQRTPSLGSILLVPRASMFWLSLGSAAAAVAIICFLVFGTYTRRSTVTGQLSPAGGVVRVFTPQAGVVLEKNVIEGQIVKKGDVLFVLSSDRPGLGSRELQADISAQVAERRRSLEGEIARNRTVESGEASYLARRVNTLRAEGEAIAKQIEQQRGRVKLAEEARARYQGLADKDFIAREQLFLKEAELSEQQSRMQTLQRDALVSQREMASSMREIESARIRYANQNAQLQRGISYSDQELTEVEGKRRVVITAPQAGRATLLAAGVGHMADPLRPLVSLVPEDAKLEARFYAPSQTVGFVRRGDPVLLRFQSFPYQKFGQYEGTVSSVSRNAVPSAELAGFTLPDVPVGEPVYSISVTLKDQYVKAFGKERPLVAGMRLDGDVLLETRRLYEWVLEPLYSISGKM